MLIHDQFHDSAEGETTSQQKVLVADDHLLVRDAIVAAISKAGGFQIFVASSLNSVFEQLKENGPFSITLLDINMPGMNGVSSVQRVVDEATAGAVVMLSGNASHDFVSQGMSVGASGFVSKSMRLGALAPALKLVLSGEKFIATSIISDFSRNQASSSDEESDKLKLTKQEREILRLVAQGLQNKEVAWQSGQSEVKVKMHMRNICKKLDVTNRTGAALKARELGIL